MTNYNKYFYCYSKPMRNYLMDKNFKFITTAYAVSTGKQFWMFESSSELIESVEEYNELRVSWVGTLLFHHIFPFGTLLFHAKVVFGTIGIL